MAEEERWFGMGTLTLQLLGNFQARVATTCENIFVSIGTSPACTRALDDEPVSSHGEGLGGACSVVLVGSRPRPCPPKAG